MKIVAALIVLIAIQTSLVLNVGAHFGKKTCANDHKLSKYVREVKYDVEKTIRKITDFLEDIREDFEKFCEWNSDCLGLTSFAIFLCDLFKCCAKFIQVALNTILSDVCIGCNSGLSQSFESMFSGIMFS